MLSLYFPAIFGEIFSLGLNEDPPSRRLFAYFHDLPTPSSSLYPTLPFPFLAKSRSVHSCTLHHASRGSTPPRPGVLSPDQTKIQHKIVTTDEGCKFNASSIPSINRLFSPVHIRKRQSPRRSSFSGHPRGTSRSLFITRLKPTCIDP